MHENTSTQILKYPRDATPIPGPHLGRSELFNRSVSATTTNDLSRVVFSLFLLLLLLCIPRGIRSRLGEKKVLFFRAIFLQSDLSSKKAAKREEFSVTFHNNNKQQTVNAQISSHRLIFTLVISMIDCALNLLPPRKNTFARSGVV